jgi:thioredoxin reductase
VASTGATAPPTTAPRTTTGPSSGGCARPRTPTAPGSTTCPATPSGTSSAPPPVSSPTPNDGALNDGALNDGALNDGALNDGALNDGALNDGALNDGALNDGALNDGALNDGALNDGASREVLSRTVVVATGAYDRQLPFPGWTLPGVYTAGGVQALLKGHGVVAGKSVVVAGTGPFLLPVAAGLAEAGATVLGVFEAGRPTAFARHPLTTARAAVKLAEAAHYLRTLRRHRVPYRTRTTVVEAEGTDSVTGAVVARLDARWRIVPGTRRQLECDTVAVGYGFTPQTEIPLQLGCAMDRDADGSLTARVDTRQRSTVPGVYAAGEACGVGGAQLACTEGELAGLHAAYATTGARPDPRRVARLLRRRAAERGFAAALQEAYPVRPGWREWLTEDTVVCRCEEVTAGAIRHAVKDLGATGPRAVKLCARPGMGLCQGRVCGYATAVLAAAHAGREVTEEDLRGLASRPIAQPVPLGLLRNPGNPGNATMPRHDQEDA